MNGHDADESPNVFSFMESVPEGSGPASVPMHPTKSAGSSGYAPSDGGSPHHSASTPRRSPSGSTYVNPSAPIPTMAACHDSWSQQDRFNDSGISMRDSSPEPSLPRKASIGKQPSVHDSEDEGEEEEEEEEEREGDWASRMAMARRDSMLSNSRKSQPSRTQSRQSDEHRRQRLVNQEEQLRQHIDQSPQQLQSPQPKRRLSFFPNPTPELRPPMPSVPPSEPQFGLHNSALFPPPPAYPPGPSGPSPFLVPPPPQHMQHQPPPFMNAYRPPDLSKTTLAGYELLATELSKCDDPESTAEHSFQPLYRKFETLNHRVLLHLQEEITELEEELRVLDECIAQLAQTDEEGNLVPASRRRDARCGGELQYRRTDLLGRIFIKLGQYNQALASYSNMVRNCTPARADDVRAYQEWMATHRPVDPAEARFLDRDGDLMSVARPARRVHHGDGRDGRCDGAAVGSGAGDEGPGGEGAAVAGATAAAEGAPANKLHAAALGLLVCVMPLVAFVAHEDFAGRVVMLGAIGVAGAVVITSTGLWHALGEREWGVCGAV
ncbi:hypothetical protein BDY21DRAFT_75331 [Lineolata rhizophorae]|uniref:DUF6594 domain-containing protein n=1 Tax=Lineolata rhizophorae TaxID=578093 RepID=A0A6A6NV79_9PEZI|nr:hypothetical protein BDY21DRAFT_75331 [Lineolata rhizophorae]